MGKMSDSDDDPPRRKIRKNVKNDLSDESDDDNDNSQPTFSMRLKNKKTFQLPSRKSAFSSIGDEETSPVKRSTLRERKRCNNLVKERSDYNQRDGFSTDGSHEGEMDNFIDDNDVSSEASSDEDAASDSADIEKSDSESTKSDDGEGCSSAVPLRRSVRNRQSRDSKPAIKLAKKRAKVDGASKKSTPKPLAETPPPTTSDCESEGFNRYNKSNKNPVSASKRKKLVFQSDSSDEESAEVVKKLKAGSRRKGKVLGSDESDAASVVGWTDEDEVICLSDASERWSNETDAEEIANTIPLPEG